MGGKSSTFWKWHCLRKIVLYRIKTPYPYLMNLVSNYLEKNILFNTAKINGIQSITSLKLRIKIVVFFLGHLVWWLLCYSSGKTMYQWSARVISASTYEVEAKSCVLYGKEGTDVPNKTRFFSFYLIKKWYSLSSHYIAIAAFHKYNNMIKDCWNNFVFIWTSDGEIIM